MFLGIKEYLPSGPLEIVATIFSTLAMIMFIVSAAIKNKKKVILNQSAAQMLLIFRFIEQEIINAREKNKKHNKIKTMIIVDEAHLCTTRSYVKSIGVNVI